MLLVVFHSCGTSSLTLRDEHTPGLNMVLTRIFVPKRDKGTGGWRKFHDEKFYHF
jgi:hypothetical protein